MSVLAMKFGGTSVGSSAAIGMLCQIVHDQKTQWDNVAVVVSAMSGVTDILINGANAAARGDKASAHTSADALRSRHITTLHELAGDTPASAALAQQINTLISEYELLIQAVGVLGEASPRALDAIASLGERMSVRLVTAALQAKGTPAQAIDANTVVLTTAEFGNGAPIYPQTRDQIQSAILPLFAQGITPVITGFIGATASGAITTLGRGGSDYSGAIFGEALDADEVDIYTDKFSEKEQKAICRMVIQDIEADESAQVDWIEKRKKASATTFNIMAPSTAEPPVCAAKCTSGNQV